MHGKIFKSKTEMKIPIRKVKNKRKEAFYLKTYGENPTKEHISPKI
jgi:hypothetical protein